jgi:hypothetical protein
VVRCRDKLEAVEWFWVDGVFAKVAKCVTGGKMCQRCKESELRGEGETVGVALFYASAAWIVKKSWRAKKACKIKMAYRVKKA